MFTRPAYEFGLLRQAGDFLARLPFNNITHVEIAGRRFLKKRRRAYAPILVPMANWYAAQIGSKMRILTGPAWFRNERLLYELLLGRPAPPCGNCALLLPRLPGRSLFDVLQCDPGLGDSGRMALKLAATELARIHACWTLHPRGGGLQQFSHADATIRNVLIDDETQTASWIDFETTHIYSLPAMIRHADDLLTLVSSAVAIVETVRLPSLCEILLSSYGNPLVSNAMSDMAWLWNARPTARRLGFPHLEDCRWQLLCGILS